MRITSSRLWAAGLSAILSAGAAAQPTAFTYQGQLKDGGAPAGGSYDMTFRLFDADSGGTQIGADIVIPGMGVTGGLFTTELDFGVDAYTDNQPRWLEITVNAETLVPLQPLTPAPFSLNTRGINVGSTGNVGIGTAAPAQKLTVAGTIHSTTAGFKFPDGTLQTTAAIGGGGSIWSLNGTNAYYNAGKVGIGRSDPPDPLSFSNITGDKIALYGDTGGTFGFGIQGGLLQIHTNNSTADIAFGYGPSVAFNERMRIRGNGNVGIGTSAPAAKLDIAAIGDGAALLRFSTERPWSFRQAYTGSGTALRLQPETGLKNFEITAAGGTNVATFVGDDAFPRLGIGTTNPTSTLTVVGTTAPYTIHGAAGATGVGVVGTAGGGVGARGIHGSVSGNAFCGASGDHQGSQNYGLLGTANEGIYARGVGTDRAISAYSDAANAVHAESNGNFCAGVTGVSLHPAGFGGYFQNNAGGLALRCNGRASVSVLEITGADLAEKFPTSDKVEPGMVVAIDADNAGHLCLARGAYNSRVAGVVSGAGNLPAGAILGNLPGQEDAPAVALSGRVWVRCDASAAAIDPGDLLTTSDMLGHAMRAVDRERSHGAVFGKAMTALRHGERGLVLVLVNLQ